MGALGAGAGALGEGGGYGGAGGYGAKKYGASKGGTDLGGGEGSGIWGGEGRGGSEQRLWLGSCGRGRTGNCGRRSCGWSGADRHDGSAWAVAAVREEAARNRGTALDSSAKTPTTGTATNRQLRPVASSSSACRPVATVCSLS